MLEGDLKPDEGMVQLEKSHAHRHAAQAKKKEFSDETSKLLA